MVCERSNCHRFRELLSRVILERCDLNSSVFLCVNPAVIPAAMIVATKNIKRSKWVEYLPVGYLALLKHFPIHIAAVRVPRACYPLGGVLSQWENSGPNVW